MVLIIIQSALAFSCKIQRSMQWHVRKWACIVDKERFVAVERDRIFRFCTVQVKDLASINGQLQTFFALSIG
jgi:hypothetical protein